MNRSTCQKCGKKRYQDKMKMINPKSLKNGKPEWACLKCIDPTFVQTSAEEILFPNSARHFNGVLKDGELCGYCHLAGGAACCDECKKQIISLDGYSDNIPELEIQKNKLEIVSDHFDFYQKNPLKTHHDWKKRNDLSLNKMQIKIGVLKDRIKALEEPKDKKGLPERTILADSHFVEKIEKTVTMRFFQTKISKGFIFENVQFVATGGRSSGEKGIISVDAYQAIPLNEYKGTIEPMYQYDHYEAVERGERERGYVGQIVTINKQEYVLVNPKIEFKPYSKDKTYHSKDWEGNTYFLDNKTKEWLIHDAKTTLYSVKKEDELHQYLNENMYEAKR